MSTASFHTSSSSYVGSVGATNEFSCTAELFVPDHLAAGLRKSAQKKKSESKLNFLSSRAGPSSTDSPKKIKEQPSFLSLPKATSTGGQWRKCTLTTADYADGCLLNIYVDEHTLYRTVPIHLLKHTDIRQADRSLFFRRYCLGIHCTPSASLSSLSLSSTQDVIYLDFTSPEPLSTWLALLRSYATPEVYGRHLSNLALPARSTAPPDGGLYRMWRHIDLSVIEGRGLGAPLPAYPPPGINPDVPPDAGTPPAPPSDPHAEMDLFCEVWLDGAPAARTTLKRGAGAAEWAEAFALADLPPLQTLSVVVCREKRGARVVLGRVALNMAAMRRGEDVEGWFPVVWGGDDAGGVPGVGGGVGVVMQVGEVRLKMRVDEEIILPLSSYSTLLDTLVSRNFLEWLAEFDAKLRLKSAPLRQHMLAIACSRDVLIPNILEEATREVEMLPLNSNVNTLFRGNSTFTKTMELLLSRLGAPFLEASIGPAVRRLCAERVAIEVDPLRKDRHMDVRDIERQVQLLATWCGEFWRGIWAARAQCPLELRRVFQRIRELVEARRPPPGVDRETHRESAWQAVSAFLFLRFFVPAILRPHLFGIVPGLPDPAVNRSLTLIGKHIQSLANLSTHVERAEFMRPVKNFLVENLSAMIDYIIDVSTPSNTAPTATMLDRSNASMMIVIRQRAAAMPLLHREAIPTAPMLHDIPKHLAIITSTIIQHTRSLDARSAVSSARSTLPDTPLLDELVQRCFEVEGRALRRVSKLAAAPRSIRTRSSLRPSSAGSGSGSAYTAGSDYGSVASPLQAAPLSPFARSPPSSIAPSDSPRARRISSPSPGSARSRKFSRPSLAPSDSEDGSSGGPFGALPPMSPLALNVPPLAPRGAWSRSSAPDIWAHTGPATAPLGLPPAPYASTGALGKGSAESMPSLLRVKTVDPISYPMPRPTKKKSRIFRLFTKGNGSS